MVRQDPEFRGARWVALVLTTCLLTAVAFEPTAGAGARAPAVRSAPVKAQLTSWPGATHFDPEVAYSTYLGGSDFDSYPLTARDRFGNLYLAGDTCSADFPTTPRAYQRSPGGGCDVFVTNLSPDGRKLIYSTYLGGSDFEAAGGFDVDASGNAYVSGQTLSADFPTTPGAFQTSAPGGLDAFVTKLNSSGSALAYSTYLGGTGDEFGGAVAVDSAGRVSVEGSTGSLDFPVTKGAFQGTFAGGDGSHCDFPCDAFAARLNRAGSSLHLCDVPGGNGR